MILFFCLGPGDGWSVRAQELVLKQGIAAGFSGATMEVDVLIRNPNLETLNTDLTTQLFQLSSSIGMPVGEPSLWKHVTILNGQTILEKLALKAPSVRAETRFDIRCLNPSGKIIGHIPLIVYPTNLLSGLRLLGGERAIGIYDPQNVLKPLLTQAKVEYENFEDFGFESFKGSLAIVAVFDGAPGWGDLTKRLQGLAERNVHTVSILPNSRRDNANCDSILAMCFGSGRVVRLSSQSLTNLANDPIPQLKLLRGAALATTTDFSLKATEPNIPHQP